MTKDTLSQLGKSITRVGDRFASSKTRKGLYVDLPGMTKMNKTTKKAKGRKK